jgi:predicted nuclease of predicted toxin-antitoxin system
MSRPRFLADHDLNEHIVTGLLRREPTVECARVREFEMGEASDDAILDYAAQHGWMVLSHDVNTMPAAAFARLANRRAMARLLMVRQTEPIRDVIESLLLVWSASEREEWNGQVVFLPIV